LANSPLRRLIEARDKFAESGVEEASETIAQSARENPDNARMQLQLGQHLQQMGEHAEAVDVYKRALKLRPVPKNVLITTYKNLMKALEESERDAEALEVAREAVARFDRHRSRQMEPWKSVFLEADRLEKKAAGLSSPGSTGGATRREKAAARRALRAAARDKDRRQGSHWLKRTWRKLVSMGTRP
jgi:tetratricopeptide (TPR) repeat protein